MTGRERDVGPGGEDVRGCSDGGGDYVSDAVEVGNANDGDEGESWTSAIQSSARPGVRHHMA